jgi:hypothetical protein
MNKTQRKLNLINLQPCCNECGCILRVSVTSDKIYSNEAIIRGGKLICYQCQCIHNKRDNINRLPVLKRWKKKIDLATGIFTVFRRIRIMINQFYYFKIKKGKPTSRMPYWITPK